MKRVEWGGVKMVLLFLALVCEQLASHEPLTIQYGLQLKEGAEIVWPAAAGSFVYLLRPPSKEKQEDGISSV